jgi:hypothetical protein
MTESSGARLSRRALGAGTLAGGLALATAAPGAADPSASENDVARLLQAYDAQGFHRTGHLADDENADWLAREAANLGATVSIEAFAIERVEPADCYVAIGNTRIAGTPVFDAAFTGPEGIDGVLGTEIGLDTLGPLAIYQPSYEAYRTQPSRKALITVTKGGRPGLALFNGERFLHQYGVPNLLVSSEDGAALVDAAARGARVQVVADVRRVPSRVRNVVASVPGSDPTARPVAVMTPRSGWWHCASERGGGIVCWLAVLQALREHKPRASVTMVASSGHELGHIGLDDFMSRRPELVTGATWLHFGANIGARDSKLTLQSPQDDLRTLGTAALDAAGHPAAGLSPPTQMPFGESRAIHRAGGRYLTFIGSNDLFHLRDDRYPDALDVEAVRRISQAAAQIAVTVSGG